MREKDAMYALKNVNIDEEDVIYALKKLKRNLERKNLECGLDTGTLLDDLAMDKTYIVIMLPEFGGIVK